MLASKTLHAADLKTVVNEKMRETGTRGNRHIHKNIRIDVSVTVMPRPLETFSPLLAESVRRVPSRVTEVRCFALVLPVTLR
jgi:hypothetical protein